MGDHTVLAAQQVKHRLKDSSGDRQRLIRDREAMFASGPRIDVANLHSRINTQAIVQQSAQHARNAGPYRCLLNPTDHLAGFNPISNRSFAPKQAR